MFLTNLFKKLEELFESPKTKAVLNDVATILVDAKPIVEAIASATPNKTISEVLKIYEQYGLPISQAELAGPAAIGNALLNLATSLLQTKFPNLSTSLIQTAVQLAVTGVKASK